jgi:hypothetical protein
METLYISSYMDARKPLGSLVVVVVVVVVVEDPNKRHFAQV